MLAAVSPVFRREFHGPLATSKDVIDIKETTIDAFRTMVNYIYHPGVVKDINCPQLLCQMLNLADGRKVFIHKILHPYQFRGLRNQYPEFREDVTEALKKLTITPNNLMFSAIFFGFSAKI